LETVFFKTKKEKRQKRSDCPGGTGKYGFNTYNLMTSMLLGFNAVSNLYANLNNNNQNNNNNNNDNDFGSVQANANDVAVSNNYMAMVITIVPPIGPPIPVIVGRALQDGNVFLDDRFKKPGVFFQDGDTKMFPNGTMLYANGTVKEAVVFYGVYDTRKCSSSWQRIESRCSHSTWTTKEEPRF